MALSTTITTYYSSQTGRCFKRLRSLKIVTRTTIIYILYLLLYFAKHSRHPTMRLRKLRPNYNYRIKKCVFCKTAAQLFEQK